MADICSVLVVKEYSFALCGLFCSFGFSVTAVLVREEKNVHVVAADPFQYMTTKQLLEHADSLSEIVAKREPVLSKKTGSE